MKKKTRTPFVFSNLATSIDGKIAPRSREFIPLGTPEDRRWMQVLRSRSDVVLFGASTLRTFRRPCFVYAGRGVRVPRIQPWNAIVTRGLEGLDPSWPFFIHPELKRIIYYTDSDSPGLRRRLKKFEKSCVLVHVSSKASGNRAEHSLAKDILGDLQSRGISRVLVEGGGALMWEFARDNLIDEYHVTLTPKVVGGTDAPTLVDGLGFDGAGILSLRLKNIRRLKNELYLVYSKKS